MKKLATLSLAIVLASSGLAPAQEIVDVATSQADERNQAIAEASKGIDAMIANFGTAFELSADEKAKVEAVGKKLKAEVAAEIDNLQSRDARDAFEEKMFAAYRGALTAEHAKTFDGVLAKAKAVSDKSRNAANVTGICISMRVFASDAGDKLPDDLGALVAKGFCAPVQFLKKGGPTKLPDNIKTAKPEEQAKWVNANSDYVYLGAGKNAEKLEGNFVVIYDKGGSIFGCADGHVPKLTDAEAAKVFEELKAGKNPPPSLKDK